MNTRTMPLHARDVSGQRAADLDAPMDATVGELLQSVLAEMRLPENDAEGRKLNYQPVLERDARPLQSSELVSDAFQEHDHIVVQPTIHAGAAA